MDSFIDCLDGEKWEEVQAHTLDTDEFKEYSISRKHEQVDATTWKVALTADDCDMKPVVVKFCTKDPFTLNKNAINKCDIRLSADGESITGINLDDMDCVVLKA